MASKPPPLPPRPMELLKSRSTALSWLYGIVHADKTSHAADKQVLLDSITAAKRTVDQEMKHRQTLADLSKQSVADPEPAAGTPAHAPWATREAARAEGRKAATDGMSALKAANPALYSSTNVANPCLPCMKNAAAGMRSNAKVKPDPKRKNVLAKVEILNGFAPGTTDGKTDPILAKKGALQWVNLRDYRTRFERKNLPAWLKTIDTQPVESFDRLSRKIRVWVKFSQPGVENFVLKLVPGKTKSYSASEQAAGGAYKLDHQDAKANPTWVSGTTDSDGIAVVEMHVRAAATDVWSVSGKDNYGTTKHSSGSIETVRGFFVCTLTMDKVTAISLNDAKAEFRNHKIFLESEELAGGAAAKLAHQRYLYMDPARKDPQRTALKARIKTALAAGTFKGKPLKDFVPYLVVCNFYDMSPSPGDTTYQVVPVFPDQPSAINLDSEHFVWDPTDAAMPWFIAAKAYRVVAGAYEAISPAPTIANFTLVGSPDGGYQSLTFTPPPSYAVETDVYVTVKIRIISGGINGFSAGAQGLGNLVAIARRTRYQVRDTVEMNQTIVHELGHKVTFTIGPEPPGSPARATPNGAEFRWLDASPTHYKERGHKGGHCYKKAVQKPNKKLKIAGGAEAKSLQTTFQGYDGHCVMFGQGGAGSKRKINFCSNCTERLALLDMETGWSEL